MGMVSSYKSRLSFENPAVNSLNALKRRSILNDDNLFGPSALNRWASSLRSSFLWYLLVDFDHFSLPEKALLTVGFASYFLHSFAAKSRSGTETIFLFMLHLNSFYFDQKSITDERRAPFLAHRSSDLRPWDYADCDLFRGLNLDTLFGAVAYF